MANMKIGATDIKLAVSAMVIGTMISCGTCGQVIIEGTSVSSSSSGGTAGSSTLDPLPTSTTTTTSSGGQSSTSQSSSEPATTSTDLPSQCPEPNCKPETPSCPGEQKCHPVLRVCLEPCTRDCDFYCIDDMVHYDPKGSCPLCDTGAHPGECILEHQCESDVECEPFGQKCAVWLTWCLDPCVTQEACAWPCIDANDNKLGSDLCPPCDLLEP